MGAGRLAPVPSLRFCRPVERQSLQQGQIDLTPFADLITVFVTGIAARFPHYFFQVRGWFCLLRGRKPITASWAEGQDNAHA